LLVNLACAWLLKDGHHHHGDDDHGHDHGHGHDHHHDLNLRAAYLHVITDALTSFLAIVALFGGKVWNANWLDPVMGIVGAILVIVWAVGLIKNTANVLLDAEMDKPIAQHVKKCVCSNILESEITDFHLWRVGKKHYACILAISTNSAVTPDDVKAKLQDVNELVHVTVEVNDSLI
ncbi:MAG: cation diffusion facilitator family transporter, partial [Gammaproteobacteria bacterium]